jgi:hypothetical protein
MKLESEATGKLQIKRKILSGENSSVEVLEAGRVPVFNMENCSTTCSNYKNFF